MKKSDFIMQTLDFEDPIMEGNSDSTYSLLSSYVVVRCSTDPSKKIVGECVKLSRKEYLEGNLESYYEREKKLLRKYRKWLHDCFGNCCTDKTKV